MSAPAYTPGPWRISEPRYNRDYGHCGYDIHAPKPGGEGWEEVWVADAHGVHVNVPLEQIEANARLIAAAPDMYEALATLADGRLHTPTTWDEAMRAARAALARAEGRDP